MKKYFTYIFVFILMVSCAKKEETKDSTKVVEPIKEETVKETLEATEEVPELIFTVQIAALKRENSSYNNVEFIKIYTENGLIKYRLGEFLTYNEARETRASLLLKYPDAFVQALKNGSPIHIKQALLN